MSLTWFSRNKLIEFIPGRIRTVRVVLDIGCGIYPQKYINPSVHICSDPYKEYLDFFQQSDRYKEADNFILLNMSWKDVVRVFSQRSIDSIFLLDVIEHLPKKEGRKLLKVTETLARKQIIIFSPLGFLPQEHDNNKDAWGLGGATYQKHKSGWYPKDFDDSWDIYAAKNYHYEDNRGNKYDKPYGAFWAIKNIDKSTSISERRKGWKREKAHELLDKMLDKINLILYKL